MRSWLIAICVALGLLLGVAGGYISGFLASSGRNPMLIAVPTENGFDRTYGAFARLATAEMLAGGCSADSTQALADESVAIALLRASAPSTGLRPQLDVAEARLEIRTAMGAQRTSDAAGLLKAKQHAETLLKQAGWEEGSAEHLLAFMQESCR